MYLVSGCLLGINCKYDGGNNYNEKVLELVKTGKAIPICPEQLGGLTTPRNPSEIVHDRVLMNDGTDVTSNFRQGAQEVLDLCKKLNITKVILKSNSPSCGCGTIYDGTFTGTKVPGNGITTELLLQNGIEVITEKDLA